MNLGLKAIVKTAAILLLIVDACIAEPLTILNVSYDPTREFYEEINQLFVKEWKVTSSEELEIQQSHGGSGKQARAVMDGLKADVVTLALAFDIDAIAKASKLISPDWQSRLPDRSAPYTSTIVFLVRKGNPKNIRDWGDLIKPDVQVITPNPKTSGGARWNYLAALAYAKRANNADQAKISEYLRELFAHVPVLDTGARASTMTFVQRGIGDVLLAWENEAFLAMKELGKDQFEMIVPSISILAEPCVAWVDGVTSSRGTQKVAEAYLHFLYTPQAQAVAAKHYFRPRNKEVLEQYSQHFPKVEMVSIDDFGGWSQAQKDHFDDGGSFDLIYEK